MPRKSPVYYIDPSSISITPNANGSPNDLAVYIARGAKIKVFSPEAGIETTDASYRAWTFSGRNRRLADSTKPYTIYARVSKDDNSDSYLVFAGKTQGDGGVWLDKYPYVTRGGNGISTVNVAPANNATIEMAKRYWFVRLGDVSEIADGKRTVDLDTGILGTDLYNDDWDLNPDDLPLRVELSCMIDDKEVGQNPYVYWNKSALLHARLVEGWQTDAGNLVHHWTITRNTGNAEADEAWNHPGGGNGSLSSDSSTSEDSSSSSGEEPDPSTARQMENGEIILSHLTEGIDDFAGAVASIFTVTAWGEAGSAEDSSTSGSSSDSSSSENSEYSEDSGYSEDSDSSDDSSSSEGSAVPEGGGGTVAIAKGIITIFAETIIGDTPISCFRWYRERLTPLVPTDTSSDSPAPAAGDAVSSVLAWPADKWSTTIPDNPATMESSSSDDSSSSSFEDDASSLSSDSSSDEPFSDGDWMLWMCSSIRHGNGVRDAWSGPVRITGKDGDPGADAKEREWIYIGRNSQTTFTDDPGSNQKPSLIETGSAGSQAVSGDARYAVDDFVPAGWSDNAIAVDDSTNKFVYASWRDWDKTTGLWGDFNDPILWSNWGHQGIDGDGVQYVYKLYPVELNERQRENFIPTKPTDAEGNPAPNANGEWLPAGRNNNDSYTEKAWTDDPENAYESYPYCYCSVIKRTNGTWGNYEKLALWAKWSADGVSITKVSETTSYQNTDDGVTIPTGTWHDSRQQAISYYNQHHNPVIQGTEWQPGTWMWVKIVISWSDGSSTTLYTNERNPNDGVNGQDIVVGTTVVTYCVSETNTVQPSDSNFHSYNEIVSQIHPGCWLWSKSTTPYYKANDQVQGHEIGFSSNYNVSYIGTDGVNGRSMTSVSEHYNVSGSSANSWTVPSSGEWSGEWTTDPNVPDQQGNSQWGENAKYLWNYEKITYNDNGTTVISRTMPHVVAIWTEDGANGKGIDSITDYYKVSGEDGSQGHVESRPSKIADQSAQGYHNDPSYDGTDFWDDNPTSPTEQEPYLWNYERITWIEPDGTNSYTYVEPHIIGHYGRDGADGASAPFYTEQSFAWSQYKSAAGNTGPGDIQTTAWRPAVPAEVSGKPFLWMRVGEYRWNSSTEQYALNGSYTYTRLTGESGTGIHPKGSFSYSDWQPGYASIAAYLTATYPSPETGDCYIYQEDGHLWVWNGTTWQDVGQIKGDAGTSAYIHFAWAHSLNPSTGYPDRQSDGFTTSKQAGETYEYIGVLSDDQPNDSTTPSDYEWTFVKGADGVSAIVLDLDNESDSILYSADDAKLSENVLSTWHLYQGAREITDLVTRNANNCTFETNGTCTASWSTTTGENAYRTILVSAIADNVLSATVAVNVIYNNVTYTHTFTVKKLKGVGKYDLVLSTNAVAVNVNNDGTSGSTSVNVKVYKTDSNGGGRRLVSSLADENLHLYFNPVTDAGSETAAEVARTGSGAYSSGYNATVQHSMKEYRVILTDSATTPDTLDQETIPITKVSNGVNGTAAVRLDIDNENDSILYNTDGTKLNADEFVFTTWRMFEGGDEITLQIGQNQSSYSLSAVGCTASWMTSGDTGYVGPYRSVKVTALSADSGHVTISVTYHGVAYTTKFNVKRSYGTTKYEIATNPTSLAYNSSTQEASATGVRVVVYKHENGRRRRLSSLTGLCLYAVEVTSAGEESWGSDQHESYNSSGYTFTSGDSSVWRGKLENNASFRFVLLDAEYNAGTYQSHLLDSENVPITRVANGANGTSPWFADLDNEMDSVPCDASGKTISVITVSTVPSLYYGSSKQSYKITGIKRNGGSFPSSMNVIIDDIYSSTIPSQPAQSHKIYIQYTPGVTIDGKDDIAITITDAQGGHENTLHFKVNGVKPGANGTDAVIYSLVPSTNQIVKRGNVYDPAGTSRVTCAVKKRVGSSAITDAPSSEYVLKYSVDGGQEALYSNSPNGILVNEITSKLVFTLYDKSTPANVLDIETIPLVKDGKDGNDINPNILLRTIFDRGLDFTREKWVTNNYGNWEQNITVDTSDANSYNGRSSVRLYKYGSEDIDFRQNVIGRVKANTWYTLSFYCKSGGSFYTFLWDGSQGTWVDRSAGTGYIDGVQISSSSLIVGGDGSKEWPSTSGFVRHSITFKTASSFSTGYLWVMFRRPSGSSSQQLFICMPKLEEGNVATAYLPHENDLIGDKGEDGHGQDGTSPWIADLDNEMDSIACDNTGHPVLLNNSTQTVSTNISLYYGSLPESFKITSIKQNGGSECSFDTGVTVKLGNATIYNQSSLPASPASSVTLSVTYGTNAVINGKDDFAIVLSTADNTVQRTLHFTVNGIRAGADGTGSVIYNLMPGSTAIKTAKTADGYDPAVATLKCGYTKNSNGEITSVNEVSVKIDGAWSLFFRKRERSGSQWQDYYYRYETYKAYSSQSLTLTNFSLANYDAVEFILCNNNSEDYFSASYIGNYTVIDKETVPVVADGMIGQDGLNGQDGWMLMANPSTVIINQSTDDVNNFGLPITIGFVAKYGNNNATVSVSLANYGHESMGLTVSPYDNNQQLIISNYQKVGNAYVTYGRITCTVTLTYGDHTTQVTLQTEVYVNLLGTWAVNTTNSATNAAGQAVQTALGPNGAITSAYTAAIQASATGLRSEFSELVSPGGNSNLFGFRKGCKITDSSWPSVPFVQGYGIVVNTFNNGRRRARIHNLGTNGVGGHFTVSFQAKVSSGEAYIHCDICDVDATTNKGTATGETKQYLTTEWSSVELHFDLSSPSNSTLNLLSVSGGNGFLDIEDVSNSAIYANIYIRHLKIERGDVATPFCAADEDIAAIGQGQLITELTNDGMNVGSYNGRLNVYSKSVNPSGGDIDCLYQNGNIPLETGKVYTLSYWACSSVSGMVIDSYLYYPDIIDGIGINLYDRGDVGVATESLAGDGYSKVRLSTEWRQYFLRFYVTKSSGDRRLLALRVPQDENRYTSGGSTYYYNGTVYMSDILLQEGYVMDETSFSSLIEQNARRISLVQQSGLKRAGIDIQNGVVTLDATTTVCTGDFYVPRVLSETDDMITIINAGGVEIRSKSNPSYGLFRLNEQGEIILSMYDKNGNRVVNLGGTPGSMTNGEWVVWKLRKRDQGRDKSYYTTTESQCTPYYQLVLGMVTNSGSSIQYFIPPVGSGSDGQQTTNQNVIDRNNMLFKDRDNVSSVSYLESFIASKNLPGDFIADGYYVKPNDGHFNVDADINGPTNYWVTLYHFENGKLKNTIKQQFGF